MNKTTVVVEASLNNTSATLNNQAIVNKDAGAQSSTGTEGKKVPASRCNLEGAPSDSAVNGDVASLDDVEASFDMAACKNHGSPVSVEWDSKSRFFIDGFGLCSPTRWQWQPWDRGVNHSSEAKDLLASIYSLLLRAVGSSITDPRRLCFELVMGRLKSCHFPLEAVEQCRAAIGALLGVTYSALEVYKGQPSHLHLVARVLKVVGGPDTAILVDGNDTFATWSSNSSQRAVAQDPYAVPTSGTPQEA